jgi:hypothetical protein
VLNFKENLLQSKKEILCLKAQVQILAKGVVKVLEVNLQEILEQEAVVKEGLTGAVKNEK